MKYSVKFILLFTIPLIVFSLASSSCNKDDNGLAPYEGGRKLSQITIEEGSYKPKITWLGGYVSVFGVNYGDKAALDSSLVFLIYKAGNDVRFPITFGEIPSGAQDLTTQFGGARIDSLEEDNTYTFWVLKEAQWNQISSMTGKILVYDSTLSEPIQIDGDTIRLTGDAHTQLTKPLDVYINIGSVTPRGRLADIFIRETHTSNNIIVSWTVKQSGVTDSLISAIGIVEGSQFNPNAEIWSVYSVSDSAGTPQFGKVNIISSPLTTGDNFTGTQVFVEYPVEGLKKETSYYLWIANSSWNGESRLLSTDYYAYILFNTN